uniref:Uncharacterized protein n=1 Tax=Meloidogyne enterolobii TaxID=390850 RepID=A0A6V7U5X5_MELEN|nr:unnamed protein product [Meloidogyne enterolobii]
MFCPTLLIRLFLSVSNLVSTGYLLLFLSCLQIRCIINHCLR